MSCPYPFRSSRSDASPDVSVGSCLLQRKPLPLTTVTLQKETSKLFNLSPKEILDVSPSRFLLASMFTPSRVKAHASSWLSSFLQHANKLYQRGLLSYPRTESDRYDAAYDFAPLIQNQTVDPKYGAFAQRSASSPARSNSSVYLLFSITLLIES